MRWLYSLLGVWLLPAAAVIARAWCTLVGNWWSVPDGGGPYAILALAAAGQDVPAAAIDYIVHTPPRS